MRWWPLLSLVLASACSIDLSALPGAGEGPSDARPPVRDSGRVSAEAGVDAWRVDPDSGRMGVDAAFDAGGREQDGGPRVRDAAIVEVDAGPRTCPSGYSPNDVGTCYRVVTSPTLDWQDAERDCEADGTHLVVVNSAAEDALLPDYHWIGYSETIAEGTFLWVTGAGASSYAVWGGTDPDLLADAWCVVTRPDDWHDDNCFELKSYICEYDGDAADPATWR